MSEESSRRGPLRRLYDYCLYLMSKPGGVWVLFWVAVVESSVFPIPPDVFLMALAIAVPAKAFRFALICTAGSVLGGMLGYGLGYFFMELIGHQVIAFYGMADQYLQVQALYQRYDAWAVGAAGFTPLPYKLFTLTAGAFELNFATFCLASLISRGARFFMVAAFIYYFGPAIRSFIERYFNLLTIIFLVLLIGGFVVFKTML
ncbi:YqaA family protein [Desulfurivibrio dismutans]|uniref:YqaA family protein n=1 Tax=Desulfurivibrio dismutans TaxID=1398908 RepID=UPI0023D987BA|nr:VTT domain-containing protein [Desulfurivibrio alkaliphilus]MDF1615703.1 VTT domain-containing protein [Desulfurivibrio alkaliphilus]